MQPFPSPSFTPVVKIQTPHPDCRAPLYEPREFDQSWPAHFWIDTKTNTAGWRFTHYVSGGPPEYWYGFEQRIDCSSRLTGAQLISLSSQVSPMVDRVCAGAGETWDGRNLIATFTKEARRALREIEAILEEVDGDIEEVWDAGDWLSQSEDRVTPGVEDGAGLECMAIVVSDHVTITATTSNAELQEAFVTLQAEAWRERTLITGLSKYLQGLRDECVE